MTQTTTARHGETVDMICARHYGKTREVTELTLAANPGLAAFGPIVPAGTVVIMPVVDTKTTARKLVDLW